MCQWECSPLSLSLAGKNREERFLPVILSFFVSLSFTQTHKHKCKYVTFHPNKEMVEMKSSWQQDIMNLNSIKYRKCMGHAVSAYITNIKIFWKSTSSKPPRQLTLKVLKWRSTHLKISDRATLRLPAVINPLTQQAWRVISALGPSPTNVAIRTEVQLSHSGNTSPY